MNKLSQKPQETKLKVLEKQIKGAEEHLSQLKTQINLQNQKSDEQRKQQQSDNKELQNIALEQINNNIDEHKALIDGLKKTVSKLEDEKRLLVSQIDGLQSDIANIEHRKSVLEVTNSEINKENRDLKSEIKVLEAKKESIDEKISDSTTKLSALSTKKQTLVEEVQDIETKLSNLQTSYDDLEVKYNENEEKYKNNIGKLRIKLDGLAQDAIQADKEHEHISDNLIKWQRRLEERDRNLRIREAKIDQREKVLIRNSNLLNL